MRKPFGIASDIHCHNWTAFSTTLPNQMNSRLSIVLDQLSRVGEEIQAKGGDTLYLTGDIFHVRGSVAPSVLNPTLETIKGMIDSGLRIRVIPGNHDLESKNSQKLTSAVQVLGELGCEVSTEPVLFFDDQVVMIPWFENLDDLRLLIEKATAAIPDRGDGYSPQSTWTLMIHAPVNGVIPGLPDHGLDPKWLEELDYKFVFAGHYHNFKDFENGVYSVGALTHQTWGDVGTKAGFVMVTDDEGVYHVESTAPKFIDFNEDWDDDEASLFCEGNYVRVRMGAATESEIKKIREAILNEFNAAGCIVQATPVSTVAPRTSAITSGVSMAASISDWIAKNIKTVDHKQLQAECEDILQAAESVEE